MPDLDIPIMDLSRPLSEGGEAIGWRLLAYLTWPSDEVKREQYLATLDQDVVSILQALPMPGELVQLFPEFSESELNEHWTSVRIEMVELFVRTNLVAPGRLGLVANAPALQSQIEESEDHVQGWLTAGHILFLIYLMDKFHRDDLKEKGGASLNKAADYIEAKQPDGLPRNRKDIMRLWSEYKPVAHIATALLIMFPGIPGGIQDRMRAMFLRVPGITLAIAKVFEEFGLAFRSRGQSESLLDPNRLWTIPDALSLPTPVLNFSPLPADDLRQIQEYRAPKRL